MAKLEEASPSPADGATTVPGSSPSQQPHIVATQKFRSSRPAHTKQQQVVVDDWDADSDEEVQQPNDPFESSKKEWTTANNQAPTANPVLSEFGRTLPSAAYGSGFSGGPSDFPKPNASVAGPRSGRGPSIAASSGRQQVAVAPPKILQRPKNVPPGMHSSGGSGSGSSTPTERKTVEQRQEEYRLARARIFGDSSASKGTNG